MPKPKTRPYPQAIVDLMAEKTAVLSKARALADLGMPETAASLWLAATFLWMLRDQRRRHAARANRLARAMDVPDEQRRTRPPLSEAT